MELLRTELVLDTSRRHVGALSQSPDAAEIANYLAQIAAITFYAEVEEKVRKIISDRLAAPGDGRLAYFLFKNKEGMIKRVSKADLVETLVQFGADCRDELNRRFDEAEITKYSNVISGRHRTSHGPGAEITLEEVHEAKAVAERLLDSISEIIHTPGPVEVPA